MSYRNDACHIAFQKRNVTCVTYIWLLYMNASHHMPLQGVGNVDVVAHVALSPMSHCETERGGKKGTRQERERKKEREGKKERECAHTRARERERERETDAQQTEDRGKHTKWCDIEDWIGGSCKCCNNSPQDYDRHLPHIHEACHAWIRHGTYFCGMMVSMWVWESVCGVERECVCLSMREKKGEKEREEEGR